MRMLRWLGIMGLALLLVVPTVLAQAPGPRYGGTLRAGMQTDPVGLDPHLTTATSTRNMMENVYDTVVQIDPTGRIVPGLATSWQTSPDGLVWTFTLRGNVKFHNGRAMTADDVVYSLNRIRDPKTKSPRASDFAIVDSVTATGPLTVAIRLKQPFSPMLAKLALSTNVIVPHEVVEKDGDLNTEPVGTGPYRFVEYTPQQRLVLVRSGDFWGFDATGRRLPYIDRIEFDFYPDAVARVTALKTGNVEWIEYVPSSEVQSLRGDSNIQVVGGLSANFRGLYINMTVPPFNNVKVRQAMAWAVDRKQIVDTALFGVGGIVATGTTIPPGNYYAMTKNVYNKVDVDKGKQLMAEAGFPNGVDAELYVTSTYDFLRTPAELVQAQLAKVGIRTKIVAADWSVYLPTVFQKHYTLTILGNSGQADPDDFLYNPFHTGVASNYLNYSDAQFDKLVEQGRAVSSEAQRRAIYQQAQQRLQDTVPMVFLFYSTQYEALRNNVHGYQHWLTTSYLGLRTTWMTP